MDDDRAAFEARVGTVLRGKWTLERLLGVGGMAAVYAARHKIGRLDAIKILHPEVARSGDSRARFEQEAHAVNRLRHPGAVEIRDLETTEDGAPFIVMELLDGEPLSEIAKRSGGLGVDVVLRYADELLDVLAAAHAEGIIHRDVKPDNLFILRDGRLKVLDFGIARMREGAPVPGKTRTGATLGTLGYMPPEQITGRSNLDARADLFAVGATMFRVIANRRIHDARTESELLVKMATRPAPPFASVVPSAPPAVCAVIDRALAFDRDQRYPDARAMQADVRAARATAAPPGAAGPTAGPLAAPPAPPAPIDRPTPGPASARSQLTMATAATMLADARSLPAVAAAASAAATPLPAAAAAPAPAAAATPMPSAAAAPAPAAAAAPGPRATGGLKPDDRRAILVGAGGCAIFLLIIGGAAGLWCWSGQPEGAGAEGTSIDEGRPAVEAPPTGKPPGRGKKKKGSDD